MRVVPERESQGRIVADPVLHHRLRPGLTTTDEGVPYATNSRGLRDREYRVPKPPGTVRILMLGDSFTEGGGLRLEDTVAKRAERRLAARGCRGHEVVNAGVASYSPILEYLLLRDVGLALEPDLVVLAFDMTDVHDDYVRTRLARLDGGGLPVAVPADRRRETAIVMPPPAMPPSLRLLAPLESSLHGVVLYQKLRRSRLGRRLAGPPNLRPDDLESRGLVGDLRYDRLASTRGVDTPSVREGWRLTARYLGGIQRLARSHGAGFVLVAYPYAHQVSATESPVGRSRFGIGPGLETSLRPFAALEAIGREDGFPVIDLLEAFRRRDRTEGPLFRHDDIHHTPAGARVFGEEVAEALLARGLLPRCAVSPGGSG
jgi:hypothetical protein